MVSDSDIEPTPADNSPPSALTLFDWWPIALVLFLYGAFFFVVLFCLGPFSGTDWQRRGMLGDSFGVLSALFNGLAFAGLIIAIIIQSRELKLQRQQLMLQGRELVAQRREAAIDSPPQRRSFHLRTN